MITILMSLIFTFLFPGCTNQCINGKKPEIKNNSSVVIQCGRHTYLSHKVLRTSPGIFSLLNFKRVEWNKLEERKLTEGIVLPLKTKVLLFGDDSALGKVLVADSVNYEVIGIIRDMPERCRNCYDYIILSSKLELSPESLTNIRCSIIM